MFVEGLLLFGESAGFALLCLVVSAAQAPVYPAVAPRGEEGETDQQPSPDVEDAEGSEQVECDGGEEQKDGAGAGGVDVGDERVEQQGARDAAYRDGVEDLEVAGQEGEQGRGDQDGEQKAGELDPELTAGGASRAHGTDGECAEQQREGEGGCTFKLEQQVAGGGTEAAGPVVDGLRACGVERGVGRAIGDEGEQEQGGGEQ